MDHAGAPEGEADAERELAPSTTEEKKGDRSNRTIEDSKEDLDTREYMVACCECRLVCCVWCVGLRPSEAWKR